MYKGSCLCGRVSYEVTEEIGDFGFCHCQSCRKASGSAHAANVGISRSSFLLNDPDGLVTEFESKPGKFRSFCSRCGSPLYAYLSDSPEYVRIRLGSLDTDFDKKPSAHTFVGHSAKWDLMSEEIPRYQEWAPKSALNQLGSKQPES
jgi:hypothetical protein